MNFFSCLLLLLPLMLYGPSTVFARNDVPSTTDGNAPITISSFESKLAKYWFFNVNCQDPSVIDAWDYKKNAQIMDDSGATSIWPTFAKIWINQYYNQSYDLMGTFAQFCEFEDNYAGGCGDPDIACSMPQTCSESKIAGCYTIAQSVIGIHGLLTTIINQITTVWGDVEGALQQAYDTFSILDSEPSQLGMEITEIVLGLIVGAAGLFLGPADIAVDGAMEAGLMAGEGAAEGAAEESSVVVDEVAMEGEDDAESVADGEVASGADDKKDPGAIDGEDGYGPDTKVDVADGKEDDPDLEQLPAYSVEDPNNPEELIDDIPEEDLPAYSPTLDGEGETVPVEENPDPGDPPSEEPPGYEPGQVAPGDPGGHGGSTAMIATEGTVSWTEETQAILKEGDHFSSLADVLNQGAKFADLMTQLYQTILAIASHVLARTFDGSESSLNFLGWQMGSGVYLGNETHPISSFANTTAIRANMLATFWAKGINLLWAGNPADVVVLIHVNYACSDTKSQSNDQDWGNLVDLNGAKQPDICITVPNQSGSFYLMYVNFKNIYTYIQNKIASEPHGHKHRRRHKYRRSSHDDDGEDNYPEETPIMKPAPGASHPILNGTVWGNILPQDIALSILQNQNTTATTDGVNITIAQATQGSTTPGNFMVNYCSNITLVNENMWQAYYMKYTFSDKNTGQKDYECFISISGGFPCRPITDCNGANYPSST